MTPTAMVSCHDTYHGDGRDVVVKAVVFVMMGFLAAERCDNGVDW